MDDPRACSERAYAELCRRMAGLRDQDPAKLRFYWGSLFVHVRCELGGLAWDDVEPLWHRWREGTPARRSCPSGHRRRPQSRRGRRRGVRLAEPFPLPAPADRPLSRGAEEAHAPETAP